MVLRAGLLGLLAVVAVACPAPAQPPINPMVEGREPDPVVRQFHGNEPATFGYGSGPVGEPRAAFDFGMYRIVADSLGDLFQNALTMPLGTVSMLE